MDHEDRASVERECFSESQGNAIRASFDERAARTRGKTGGSGSIELELQNWLQGHGQLERGWVPSLPASRVSQHPVRHSV
jgi:hypothetical protein